MKISVWRRLGVDFNRAEPATIESNDIHSFGMALSGLYAQIHFNDGKAITVMKETVIAMLQDYSPDMGGKGLKSEYRAKGHEW